MVWIKDKHGLTLFIIFSDIHLNTKKQTELCECTIQEVSLAWLLNRIPCADSDVRMNNIS